MNFPSSNENLPAARNYLKLKQKAPYEHKRSAIVSAFQHSEYFGVFFFHQPCNTDALWGNCAKLPFNKTKSIKKIKLPSPKKMAFDVGSQSSFYFLLIIHTSCFKIRMKERKKNSWKEIKKLIVILKWHFRITKKKQQQETCSPKKKI